MGISLMVLSECEREKKISEQHIHKAIDYITYLGTLGLIETIVGVREI
jgi:hypothetical protein